MMKKKDETHRFTFEAKQESHRGLVIRLQYIIQILAILFQQLLFQDNLSSPIKIL